MSSCFLDLILSAWLVNCTCRLTFCFNCPEAHSTMVESPGNLALPNNGNLMVVCPRGGCSASLDADQSRHFNWLHGALCCVVRKCEASKRAVTADPLLLKFSSDSCVETLYAVVAFSTRAWPMDIVLLRLEKDPGDSEDGPYKLRLKHGVGSHALVAQEDIAFCMSLATRAVDWTIGQLLLGDIGGRLDQFDVHAEQPFSKEDLDGMQRKMKEEQLAQRAARIAQGLKRKGDSQGKKPGGNKARRKGKATDKVEEWNLEKGSDSERELEKDVIFFRFFRPGRALRAGSKCRISAGEAVPTEAALPTDAEVLPASSSSGVDIDPPAASSSKARTLQSRGFAWGPFTISPIYSQQVHTGWGAICGLHADKHGTSTQCKKAVTLGQVGDHGVAVVRLKRWLLAGLEDASWPKHCQRQHHVSLGGKGLQAFEAGPSETELDETLAKWVSK